MRVTAPTTLTQHTAGVLLAKRIGLPELRLLLVTFTEPVSPTLITGAAPKLSVCGTAAATLKSTGAPPRNRRTINALPLKMLAGNPLMKCRV